MGRFKPNCYLIYTHRTVENLKWECTTHYRCMAHIPNMLHELLNVKSISGELKLIWNDWHERELVKKYDVTYKQLEHYVKADSGMLSFSSERTRDRAIRELKRLGADEFYLVDNYRDVILSQAHYYENGTFPEGYGVKTPQ